MQSHSLRTFAFACGLLIAFFASASIASMYHVDVSTNRLVDGNGREVIFHGTNVVYKGFPYHPATTGSFTFDMSFVEEDAQLLQQWGMNAIRLGMMWPGVEPVRGQYNESYIQVMEGIVQLCAKYGISVLLDMHQDDFSQVFCGEGIPNWATVVTGQAADNRSLAFPMPLGKPFESTKSGSLPTAQECAEDPWPSYYGTFALGSACQNLYDNVDGLADSWANFWGKVAQTFVAYENVLGYELMNEPWAGDAYLDPLLMIPGEADKKNLLPFYERAAKVIRQYDEETPIFFEGVTWDDVVSGFDSVPGGPDYANRSVLSFHFYQPPNLSPWEQLKTFSDKAKKLGCGWFLTECYFGDVVSESDKFLQSWLFWEYKSYIPLTGSDNGFWNSNGTENTGFIRNASRPYVQSTSGHLVSMEFDYDTAIFELHYEPNLHISEPTQLYLSKQEWYPNGFLVDIHPEVVSVSQTSDNVVIISPKPNCKNGERVKVTFKPQ
eukprot:TRINITY_DN2952_c0_g1_i2.p1 TRINITY_DN2952_c0_g1~~TRINITY_DN2952_c0_g1_i2.p1  ORF type:complete len:493 (-),score=126.54 TRINITY_DN2952_c0_g1_i2:52-1530(-)